MDILVVRQHVMYSMEQIYGSSGSVPSVLSSVPSTTNKMLCCFLTSDESMILQAFAHCWVDCTVSL